MPYAAALFKPQIGTSDQRSDADLLKKALAFIEANLGNPDLAPARLEGELALSRSSLYRLFDEHGGIGGVIMRMRLERSMKALIEAGSRPMFRESAAHFGFRSEEHFSRSFRLRYGMTPRNFHDLVTRRNVVALRKLAQAAGFAALVEWIEQTEHATP